MEFPKWADYYPRLEKQIKEHLKDATPEQCIKTLHKELHNIHKGLVTDNLEKILYHYEAAQFIMENYYKRKAFHDSKPDKQSEKEESCIDDAIAKVTEYKLIGCLLQVEEAFEFIKNQLCANDFSEEACKEVFDAMCRGYADGKRIIVSVVSRYSNLSEDYIETLQNNACSLLELNVYANAIRKRSVHRQLIECAKEFFNTANITL